MRGRTKNSEWLMQENDTSRNYMPDIILYGTCGKFFRTRRNKLHLQENDVYRNNG
jgi:hypothetical protein